MVSGSRDNTIRVWNAHTGAAVTDPLYGHTREVTSVAFSPDGTHIVSGSWDKTIRIWDAQTGITIAGPFYGHTREVTSVAFSSDGTHIVSGSWDKTIRVWDTTTHTIKVSSDNTYSSTSSSMTESSFDNLQFTPSGWLYLNTLPILWISPHLFTHMPHPQNTLLIGPDGTAFAYYNQLQIGTLWSQCFLELEN